jgi:hypothetical protein
MLNGGYPQSVSIPIGITHNFVGQYNVIFLMWPVNYEFQVTVFG